MPAIIWATVPGAGDGDRAMRSRVEISTMADPASDDELPSLLSSLLSLEYLSYDRPCCGS